jgi:hypothetical protein
MATPFDERIPEGKLRGLCFQRRLGRNGARLVMITAVGIAIERWNKTYGEPHGLANPVRAGFGIVDRGQLMPSPDLELRRP